MDPSTYAAFAMPVLGGITFVAYKHPAEYLAFYSFIGKILFGAYLFALGFYTREFDFPVGFWLFSASLLYCELIHIYLFLSQKKVKRRGQ